MSSPRSKARVRTRLQELHDQAPSRTLSSFQIGGGLAVLDRDDGGVGKGGVNCSQPASVEFVQAASDSMAALAPSDLCSRQVSETASPGADGLGPSHAQERKRPTTESRGWQKVCLTRISRSPRSEDAVSRSEDAVYTPWDSNPDLRIRVRCHQLS